MATLPSCPGCGWHLQIAQVQLLVRVLVHPLQGLECSVWCLSMVQVLDQVHHIWPPTLQEGSQLQPGVHHSVDGGLLSFLNLLLGNPSAGLFPFGLESVCEDAGRLVGAHTNEHGHEAIDPLLNGLADVLVHVDGLGLLFVDRLANRAESH